MQEYLKVKIASLAEEARIIRKKERVALKDARRFEATGDPEGAVHRHLFFGLRRHRTFDVRSEARHALLALAFLRGCPYRRVEQKAHVAPLSKSIARMLVKFGDFKTPEAALEAVNVWLEVPPTALAA